MLRQLTRQLDSDRFDLADFGRQQLKQMLSSGPYVFLSVPIPRSVGGMSEESCSHVASWKRDDIQGVIADNHKVRGQLMPGDKSFAAYAVRGRPPEP